MVRTMSLGRYFQRKPIADLSGGKDSRLLAAAALTSEVTDTVRTVRSDHGEVETAEELVAAYKGNVIHLVTDVATPSTNTEGRDLEEHISTMMKGTEGATVPFTALRGPSFSGYVPFVIARFNGHGGEALHGGEYYKGPWAAKLQGRGSEGALERLTAMVSVARATTDAARAQSVETMRNRINTGLSMGVTTAHGLLNYHYSAERMPLWASSSPNRSVITPYYSSGLLKQIGRTFTGPSEFDRFYNRILQNLIPEWTSIPFYRPQGSTRKASQYFWQTFAWEQVSTFVHERADLSRNFDAKGILSLMNNVEIGDWSKSTEASLSRFIWEVSIDSVIEDINVRADEVRSKIV